MGIQQRDMAKLEARYDAAGYGTLHNHGAPSTPQRYCVCCCERVATTASEGVGHPVCEPCAREDARNIRQGVVI